MTKQELVEQVQNELTGSGMLPKIMKDAEIERVINQSMDYFYEMYKYAVELQRFILPRTIFNTPEFKRSRTVVMPDNVVAIQTCKEINGGGRLGNIDRDFSENKLIASEVFLSSMHGDDLVMRVAQYQWFDLAKAFLLDNIAYNFNKNTKKLQILGRDPKYKVLLECSVIIDADKLYNDYYFIRYCIAKSKESFSRIVGMYNMPLPGGIEVNHEMLRSEAEAELDKLQEYFAEHDPPDWFLTFH
jgi:hypothetical protein